MGRNNGTCHWRLLSTPQGGPVPNERTKTNRNKNQRWTLTTNLGTAFCLSVKLIVAIAGAHWTHPTIWCFIFSAKSLGGVKWQIICTSGFRWTNKHQHRKRGVQNSMCPQESILLMYDFQWNPTLFFRGSWPRGGL